MWCDHPSNKKLGCVCICYKNYLLSRIIDSNYLNECVRFEVMIDDKFAISLCIGPQVNHKTNWNLSKKTQR